LNSRWTVRWAVLMLSFVFGCTPPSAPGAWTRIAVSDGWLAMGTFFEADLRVRPDEAGLARAWLDWARIEIARLERIYSRHDPNSALSVLNRELARGDDIQKGARLGPELESVLLSANLVWAGSEGAFDITVGPLIEVWKEAERQGKWPTVEGLRQAKRHVGSEGLLLLGDGNLGLTTRGIRIDLDGIAKGAVLDHLRERFEAELPGGGALLSFGQSSVIAIGDADRDGWKLVVRSRAPSTGPLATVRLRNQALSVSSSVGSVREIAGERVSHIIDPQTGSAVEGTVEAIVVGDRAALADGWSTALLVLGANQAALRLIEGADLEAYVLESSGRSVGSAGWESVVSGVSPVGEVSQ
jgi:thiamine biosynthesis lipoprotein